MSDAAWERHQERLDGYDDEECGAVGCGHHLQEFFDGDGCESCGWTPLEADPDAAWDAMKDYDF